MSKSERVRTRREATAGVEAQGAAERRRKWLTFALVGFPAVVTVVLLTAGVIQRAGESPDDAESLTGVESFEVSSREHVQDPVTYPQLPPVGGPHAPAWQNCGFYQEAVSSETAVHSLEHGAVWITYDPALPAADIAALRELSNEQSFVLTTPFEGLEAPLVASAWGLQLALTGPDDPQLGLFLQKYRSGPQTPEPGAPCTSGVGMPAA